MENKSEITGTRLRVIEILNNLKIQMFKIIRT
jgi:hypothetical protein